MADDQNTDAIAGAVIPTTIGADEQEKPKAPKPKPTPKKPKEPQEEFVEAAAMLARSLKAVGATFIGMLAGTSAQKASDAFDKHVLKPLEEGGGGKKKRAARKKKAP